MRCSFIVDGIRLPVSAAEQEAFSAAAAALRRAGVHAGDPAFHIRKKSVDARHRDDVSFVYSVIVDAEISSAPDTKRLANSGIKIANEEPMTLSFGAERLTAPIHIVGFGPAGMFCALLLAENGYCPIVYERGADVDARVKAVERFLDTASLDENTNVQFGAGGAGTFSDGKLTTRIGDPLCSYVLKRFCEFGAPDDILYRAKPHVGTDNLREVVRRLDAKIRELGGEIHYETHVTEVSDHSLVINGTAEKSAATVLAVGHSARDLYEKLLASGFSIVPKAFSCGVRVEHLQNELDEVMYGDFAGKYGLGHAEYALSYREGKRGVYSFCMCPGGYVMASASENGGVVTNGMSNYRRDGRNANAAIAVSVLPEDYGNTPAGAIAFQRSLERAAFRAGGDAFRAPAQLMGDFLSGKSGTEPQRIVPTYMNGNVFMTDLHGVLPPFITSMLETGFRRFGCTIRGFDAPDVPMTGVETRTSAPIRILRGDDYTAPGFSGIYPAGEGAGYAGGIMSAAVDGIRVAMAIMRRFAPPD